MFSLFFLLSYIITFIKILDILYYISKIMIYKWHNCIKYSWCSELKNIVENCGNNQNHGINRKHVAF